MVTTSQDLEGTQESAPQTPEIKVGDLFYLTKEIKAVTSHPNTYPAGSVVKVLDTQHKSGRIMCLVTPKGMPGGFTELLPPSAFCEGCCKPDRRSGQILSPESDRAQEILNNPVAKGRAEDTFIQTRDLVLQALGAKSEQAE